jgi:hypothetical protein
MKSGNAGVALILTLMILSFLAALGAALLASTTLDVWLVENYRSRVQAMQLAESSLEEARERLRRFGPSAAQPFLTVEDPSGTARVTLRGAGVAGVYVLQAAAEAGNSKHRIEATLRKGGFPSNRLDPYFATISGLDRLVRSLTDNANDLLPGGTVLGNYGSAAEPRVAVVAGDATLGPGSGFGVLLVSGRLRIAGGVSWTGVIAAIGQGIVVYDADAIIHVSGGVFSARTRDVAGQRLGVPESVTFQITDPEAIARANARFPYGWISIREN